MAPGADIAPAPRHAVAGDVDVEPTPRSDRRAASHHRHGRLSATLARRRGRTVLVGQEIAFPAGTVRLLDHDGDGVPELQQTAPAGGLLGGDALDVAVRLEDGVRASLATQGANRVYRPADGRTATRLTTTVTVADGAIAEWVPHHLLPYPGARVRQRTAIDVAPDAGLLAWESLSAGRSARGERFAWSLLDTRLRIARAGAPLLLDGAILAGDDREPFDGADLCATVALVLPRDGAPALADELHAALTAAPAVLGGASAPAPDLVVGRLLARDVPALYGALGAARRIGRRALGLPPARRSVS